MAYDPDKSDSLSIREVVNIDGDIVKFGTIYAGTANDGTGQSGLRKLIIDKTGRLHAFHTGNTSSPYDVFWAYSDDWGKTWTTQGLTSSSYNQTYPSAAIDSSGDIHLVWMGITASSSGFYNIRYKKYTADAKSWGSITEISSETAYSQYYPAVSITNAGYVSVVWMGKHGGSATYFQLRFAQYTSSWSAVSNLTTSLNDHSYPSIACDGTAGTMVVYRGSVTGLMYMWHDGSSWSAEATADSYVAFTVALYPNVICDSSGVFHTIATKWYSAGYYNIRYIKYASSSWTGGADLTSYASTSIMGYFPSIAIDNGQPHVTWSYSSNSGSNWNCYHSLYTGAAWPAGSLLYSSSNYSVYINTGFTDYTTTNNPVDGLHLISTENGFVKYYQTSDFQGPTYSINVNDSITESEDITGIFDQMLSVNDSVSISEDLELTYFHTLNVSDDITITDIPNIPPSKIRIMIDNIDRTKYIEMDSLTIESVLTSQVDTCSFVIKKITGSTRLNYNPVVGNDVTITYLNDKIFGGVITKLTQRMDSYGIVEFIVECGDYTRFLDRKLVADTFSAMTVNNIIDSITTNYLDDFTTNNVNCDVTLDYIGFNYEPVSKVLSQLADLVRYEWYVDYNKDIHFFAKDSRRAPFDLEDDTDTYITQSLQLRQDNSQLRNVIHVRGGEYLADTFTTEVECNGVDTIYNIPYKYQALTVTTSAENYPTPPGQQLTVGLDYLDTPENYDVLWNFQEKVIKFRDSRKPNLGNVLRIGGKPYLPVRVKTSNRVSIVNMKEVEGGTGEYEYVVIDNSIKTKQSALERANAELKSYQDTLVEGEFSTYKNGLHDGMQIRINSKMHEVNDLYLINRIIIRIFANNVLRYDVSVVTTKTYGIIEFLQDLLVRDNKQLSEQGQLVETVDVIETVDETFSLADTFTASVAHNRQYETITHGEVKTEHVVNWAVEFVLGPYIPSDVATDKKRQFNFDGSILQGPGISIKERTTISESVSITKT